MNNLSAEVEEAIQLSLNSNDEIKGKLVEIKAQVSMLSRSTEKVANLIGFLSVTKTSEDSQLQSLVIDKLSNNKSKLPSLDINKKLLIAALVGMLPLILPKEAVEKIKDFTEGLIGNDAVKKLKEFNLTVKDILKTVGIVSSAIVGSFIAIKLFSTVKNTIELIRQLAILTGLVSVMSSDEQDSIDRNRSRMEEHDRRIQQHYQRIARERARLNQLRINHARAVNAHRQSVINSNKANIDEQRRLQAQAAENSKKAAELDAREKSARISEQRGLARNDAQIQAARERAQSEIRAQRATAADQDRGASPAQRIETERAIAAERAKIENDLKQRVAEINKQHAQRMADLEAQNKSRIQDIERTRIEQERVFQARAAELDKSQIALDNRNNALNERQLKLNQDVAKLDEARKRFEEKVAVEDSKRSRARAAVSGIVGLGAAGIAARLGSAALKALAFLAWPLVEAMFGTVQDLFNEDIREKESITEMFLKNLASGLSSGFLNRNNIDNTIKVLQGDKATIEKNLKDIEGQSVSQGEMGGFTPVTSEDIETRMLTDERFRKQQEKVAKELEDRRLSDEQRKIYEDELRAVTEAQAKIKREDARRAAQDAARQRMIDDEKRLLEEERAKVAKETADLINKLNEEEKIRAQAAVPSDYRSASERADILRVTKGSIYTDSNKPVKDWLDKFFKSNKDGKSIDDKSYENAERKRLLRIGSVQVGTVNNTVLINQGVK